MDVKLVVKHFGQNTTIKGYYLRITSIVGESFDVPTNAEDTDDLFNRGFDLYRSLVRVSGIGATFDMDQKTNYIIEGPGS